MSRRNREVCARYQSRLAAAVVGIAGMMMFGLGCGSFLEDDPGMTSPTVRNPVGDATFATGKRVRRMSASQFVNSLEVATGQRWADYDRYAAALGEPDLVEVTEETLEPSVTFDKLVHDAARYACDLAVDSDVGISDRSQRKILRHVDPSDREEAKLRENLQFLYLSFLSLQVTPDDARLEPWLRLLTEAGVADSGQRKIRWKAVCVGLATHPDFLTY